jgi:hypothetical protein
MVCHLTDSIRMAMGQKPARDASSLLSRTMVKWAVLHLPLRWPAGITTSPEIDQEHGGTKPVDILTDVARLKAVLERVTMPKGQIDWQPHPLFGRTSEAAWLRWAYLHIDHHLRQFGA